MGKDERPRYERELRTDLGICRLPRPHCQPPGQDGGEKKGVGWKEFERHPVELHFKIHCITKGRHRTKNVLYLLWWCIYYIDVHLI